jgi:hypothetical protein
MPFLFFSPPEAQQNPHKKSSAVLFLWLLQQGFTPVLILQQLAATPHQPFLPQTGQGI